VTVNSDDPPLSGGYVNANYLAAAQALALDVDDVIALALRCAGHTQIHSGRVHERALPISHPSVRCLHQREAEVDHVSAPGATRRRVSTSVVFEMRS
jgi:hypothetical protein